MNTSNNSIQDFLKAKFEALRDWLVRHSKIVLPVILLLCVGLTILIAVSANKRKVEQEADAAEPTKPEEETLTEVPQVPLEKDVVPGINELFDTYYKAMVDGDTETMSELVYYLDAPEKLRVAETGKHTESASIEVYTKAGPKEGTYIAFVYAELKFYDYDKPIPGMRSYYVCTNEDGSLYINEDGEVSESERHYMREVQLQDDLIDLHNKAVAAYNDMVVEDSTLADFLVELTEEIEKNVGETLARAEGSEQQAEGEQAGADAPEAEAGTEAPAEGSAASQVVVTEVKTTDVVNIRTSDSETADKLGKAAVGDVFKLLEEKGNGWSKVEYDGKEAFIKSDFLEPSKTETVSAAQPEESQPQTGGDAQAAPAEPQDAASTATSGTVKVKENVRVRSGPSETSEKIATAYMGEKLEVIMKQADGWTKVKYKGKTAYVKSEFVE